MDELNKTSKRLIVGRVSNDNDAMMSVVFINPQDFSSDVRYVRIKDKIFTVSYGCVKRGEIQINLITRNYLGLETGHFVEVSAVELDYDEAKLKSVELELNLFKGSALDPIKHIEFDQLCRRTSIDLSLKCINVGQQIVMVTGEGVNLTITVTRMEGISSSLEDENASENNIDVGIFAHDTKLIFKCKDDRIIVFKRVDLV